MNIYFEKQNHNWGGWFFKSAISKLDRLYILLKFIQTNMITIHKFQKNKIDYKETQFDNTGNYQGIDENYNDYNTKMYKCMIYSYNSDI